jgi:hypothetical protein
MLCFRPYACANSGNNHNIEVLAGNRQTSVLPYVEAVECGHRECEKTVGLPENALEPTCLRLIKGAPFEGHG